MVSRVASLETRSRITPEIHPENVLEPVETKTPSGGLAANVATGALCSLVGAIFGSAALSTSFLSENGWEVVCLIPLVATLVALIGGWLGAFVHMVRSDSPEQE